MNLLSYYFLPFADNELYSGTVADFSGSDPIIYRETLQTEQYDSLSLNGNIILLYLFRYCININFMFFDDFFFVNISFQ